MITWIIKRAVVVIAVAALLAAIGFAGYFGFDIFRKMTAESLDIGSVSAVEPSEEIIAEFDFGIDHVFTAASEKLTKNLDPISFNGIAGAYVVRMNGYACDMDYVQAGQLSAATTLLFDNTEGNLDGKCSFTVNIEFASLTAKATVTVNSSTSTAAEYLNQYVYNNGLSFTVCKKEGF